MHLALHRARDDSWDILGAVDLVFNAALQEGVDIDQVNRFGLSPILSITRNSTPHFYVPLVKKLLEIGANPLKVDNNQRGILHHIMYEVSACNNNRMEKATRRDLSSLIAQLITSHGCDPLLADDGGMTPFDLALSPVAWGIWCDGLLSAGVDIEGELRNEYAKHSTGEPEECTQFAYIQAVTHLSQGLSSENFRAHGDQRRNKICARCQSGMDWKYRYQPFDILGSYLTGQGRKSHNFLTNHSDGSWCSDNVQPFSCLSCRFSAGGPHQFLNVLDAKELSWRKYVAFMLWRSGWL